jgi:hypothetical protein
MASQIVVHGCGMKAVYVYYPDADTWIIDGVVASAAAGYVSAPHVTRGKDNKRSDKKSGRRSTKAEKRGGMGPTELLPAEPAPVEPMPLEQSPIEPELPSEDAPGAS